MSRQVTTRVVPSSGLVAFFMVLVIGIAILVLFTQSYSLIYLIGAPVLVISIWNYSVNWFLLLLALNFAATRTPWMLQYANGGRWAMMFLLGVKFALPMIDRGKRIGISGIQIGFGAFCTLAILSTADAEPFKTSLYRSISLWFMYFAVFVSLWRYLDSREKVETFIRIFVYVCAGMVFAGHAAKIFIGPEGFEILGRFKGYYLNPNTLGLVMTLQIPFSFWLANSKKYAQGFFRQLHWIIFGISLYSLILSGSRAAIAGVVIGILVYLSLRYRSRMFIIAAIFATFMGASYSVFKDVIESKFFQEVIYRKETLPEGSGRLEIWKEAIKLSRKRPILGWGFGTSEKAMWAGGELTKLKSDIPYGVHTHNSFLRLLVELGWLGTIFGIYFIFSILRRIGKLLQKIPSEELYSLVILMVAGIIAGMVDSLFESWALSVGCILAVPFWTTVMLIYRMDYRVEDYVEEKDTLRKVGAVYG